MVFAAVTALARAAAWGRPAGFDAGQYLYIGDLILDGGTPYVDAVNNKGPLLYLLFAVFRLLAGTSPVLIWMTLVLFTALAALALAAYVASHVGWTAGFLAGVVLAAASNTPELSGIFIHSEHYGLAPMMTALWLASRGGGWSAAWAGAMTAAAASMNPAFALVAPFAAAELWHSTAPGRRGARFGLAAAGLVALAAPLLMWVAVAGAFDEMLAQVGGKVGDTVTVVGSAHDGLLAAGLSLGLPHELLGVLAVIGALLAARLPALRWLAVGGLLWMCVGWARVEVASYSYEQHYYLALPGIAVGIALGLVSLWRGRADLRLGVAALVVLAVLWSAALEPGIRPVVFGETDTESAFEERADWSSTASVVRERTAAHATLLAADPQVYWLADRKAPTRYFDLEETRGASPAAAERTDELRDNPPDVIAASSDIFDEDLGPLLQSLDYEPVFFDREQIVLMREEPRRGG